MIPCDVMKLKKKPNRRKNKSAKSGLKKKSTAIDRLSRSLIRKVRKKDGSLQLITARELAQMLGVCEVTIHRLARKGTMPSFKLGGRWIIDLATIQEWIKIKSMQKLRR